MKYRIECNCPCHDPGMNVKHIVACCRPDPDVEEQCRIASRRAEEALASGTYIHRCIDGEAVFYVEHMFGLMPGHIYSQLGVDEFQISKVCEYHFDKWCAEPEDKDD